MDLVLRQILSRKIPFKKSLVFLQRPERFAAIEFEVGFTETFKPKSRVGFVKLSRLFKCVACLTVELRDGALLFSIGGVGQWKIEVLVCDMGLMKIDATDGCPCFGIVCFDTNTLLEGLEGIVVPYTNSHVADD